MFTIHTLVGKEMMTSAQKSAKTNSEKHGIKKPLVMGVTVLTSIDEKVLNDEFHIKMKIRDFVCELANLAKESCLDGVIASPYEIQAIRERCGNQIIIVTPGVRPLGTDKQDQKRVLTPYNAIRSGADL